MISSVYDRLGSFINQLVNVINDENIDKLSGRDLCCESVSKAFYVREFEYYFNEKINMKEYNKKNIDINKLNSQELVIRFHTEIVSQ